jgi:type IV pilus assembly protein PilP
MKIANALLLGVVVAVGVTGCSSQIDDVKQQMDQIRKRPRGKVEAPPAFTPMPTFTYAAHQLRSPFAPPLTQDQIEVIRNGKKVQPDLNRSQEYLERFNIESLRMRGTLQKPGNTLYALIEDGDGGVQRVKVGNYLGKNQGKIVEITPNQVSIIEIVPDGRDGWVERPRSLVLTEN